MDDLTYKYTTGSKNKLRVIEDGASNTVGYTLDIDMATQSSSTNYVYNEIGELTANTEENKGFEYNASGLVTRVFSLSGNNNIATFTYNDKGLRHRKTSYDANGNALQNTYYSYDAGGAQVASYTEDLTGSNPGVLLQDLHLYGSGRVGVYNAASGSALYELTDHLGNVRAVVKDNGSGQAETVSYTDYYPHGSIMPGRNYQSSLHFPYGYQGQEKDAETGLTNFELRQYDGRIGRWYNPDPYGQHHSPYLAMSNNPVSSTDPDGGWDGSDDAFRDYMFSQNGVQNSVDWTRMTPSERRNYQSLNGTDYEGQFRDKVLDLAFTGGYEDKDGNNWHYNAKKNDIGIWTKMYDKGNFGYYRLGTSDGSMAGTCTSLNAFVRWVGLGYNGAQQKMMWAQRTYGGTGDGGILDQLHQSFSTFNTKYNPIAHGVNGIDGLLFGTDRFGNAQSGIETATNLASAAVFMFGGAASDAIVARANAPKSFTDIVANPGSLWGKSQSEVGEMLGEGWTPGVYGSKGLGWKLTKDGKSVFKNVESTRHGGSTYYGFSSGTSGKVKIVDPSSYLKTLSDKATIFFKH